MKFIDEIIEFLTDEKEEWSRRDGVKISLKDINTQSSHKASVLIEFQDGSGGIRVYEEDSVPYSEDLDLGGLGRDIVLGGASLLIPVAGPWIAGGILGQRGGQIVGSVLSGIGWKNTYIFIFNALKKCIFALEFHYSKANEYFLTEVLNEIKNAVKELENPLEEEYEDDDEWEYEDNAGLFHSRCRQRICRLLAIASV